MAADSSTSAFRVTASSDILRFRFPFSRIWSHEIQSRKSKIGENLENEYARSVFILSCLVFSHKSGRAFTLQISRALKSLQSNEMPASALSWQRPPRWIFKRPSQAPGVAQPQCAVAVRDGSAGARHPHKTRVSFVRPQSGRLVRSAVHSSKFGSGGAPPSCFLWKSAALRSCLRNRNTRSASSSSQKRADK